MTSLAGLWYILTRHYITGIDSHDTKSQVEIGSNWSRLIVLRGKPNSTMRHRHLVVCAALLCTARHTMQNSCRINDSVIQFPLWRNAHTLKILLYCTTTLRFTILYFALLHFTSLYCTELHSNIFTALYCAALYFTVSNQSLHRVPAMPQSTRTVNPGVGRWGL